MMTNEELLAALEAATEPSRELDAWIGIAHRGDNHGQPEPGKPGVVRDAGGAYAVRDYTASIDAALKLVPVGYVGRIGFGGPGYVFAFATTIHDWNGCGVDTIRAATPALALCIAALRTRSAQP